MSIPVESFYLDPQKQGTLQSRIQQTVAQGILSGRFLKGQKLPSSRKLALHLGVSRITVTLAYTELLANDYLSSKGRSGYFVSENAPEPPAFKQDTPISDNIDWKKAITTKFSMNSQLQKPTDWASYKYCFIYGQTDPSLFDHTNWRICAHQALGAKDFATLTADYFDQDDPELIEFIAQHTLPRRGILAREDEILVTLGAQNALWLATQVLLEEGRTAVIENPCYPALRDILKQSKCTTSAVDVDDKGMPPENIPEHADVIFSTPSHQCPTTGTMPLGRRQALLKRAKAQIHHNSVAPFADAIISLSCPGPAPLQPRDEPGKPLAPRPTGDAIFNYPSSMLFAPAVNMPLLGVGGLPVGVQVVGQQGEDARMTSIARWILENVAPVSVD